MQHNGGKYRKVLALAVVCAVLGYVIYAEVQEGANIGFQAATTIPMQPMTVPPSGDLNILATTSQLPKLSQLTEVVERPLFSQSRRPVRNDENPASGPALTSDIVTRYKLSGIVVAPQASTVLLTHLTSKQIIRLSKGQKIEDWSVFVIRSDRVIFRRGRQFEELRLYDRP